MDERELGEGESRESRTPHQNNLRSRNGASTCPSDPLPGLPESPPTISLQIGGQSFTNFTFRRAGSPLTERLNNQEVPVVRRSGAAKRPLRRPRPVQCLRGGADYSGRTILPVIQTQPGRLIELPDQIGRLTRAEPS